MGKLGRRPVQRPPGVDRLYLRLVLVYPAPMLTLEQCRAVDPRLESLSDEELRQARDSLYELVELAFDLWLKEHQEVSSNSAPDGLLQDFDSRSTMERKQ